MNQFYLIPYECNPKKIDWHYFKQLEIKQKADLNDYDLNEIDLRNTYTIVKRSTYFQKKKNTS